jgi:hypothetical protein
LSTALPLMISLPFWMRVSKTEKAAVMSLTKTLQEVIRLWQFIWSAKPKPMTTEVWKSTESWHLSTWQVLRGSKSQRVKGKWQNKLPTSTNLCSPWEKLSKPCRIEKLKFLTFHIETQS